MKSFDYHVLELEENDLILLPDVLHNTSEVVTVAEEAETVEITEMLADEVQHWRIPRRTKKRLESYFFFYEQKGKRSEQI